MKTLYAPLKFQRRLIGLFSTFLLLLILSAGASAQSTDIEYPTPVRAGDLSGTIAPRDLGDSRLTRYFYSFTGTPGDLIITVEGRNLEGDVDVYTAGTLRPLAKITMYAGATRSGGTNTIYLRTRQALIMRVEARTPNDSDGSFRVRFDGTFEPIGSDIPDPEPVIPTLSSESSAAAKGRRVTATGARIEEPEPVVTVTNKPETETETPGTPTTERPRAEENPTTAEAGTPQPTKPVTPRTRRSRNPRTTRSRPATTAKKPPATAESTATAPVVDPASGPRLIIETRDGMRVERYMTSVRRVTVQGGQIVVVTIDGKIDRQPMSNILRMAIEP